MWCCISGVLQSAGWTDFHPGNFGSSGSYYCWCEVLGVRSLILDHANSVTPVSGRPAEPFAHCFIRLLLRFIWGSFKEQWFHGCPLPSACFVRNKYLPCSTSDPLSVSDTVCILLLVFFLLNFKLSCHTVPKESNVAFAVT